MSVEVKRYTLLASLRPEAIAFLPDDVVSARDYDALLAERDELKEALDEALSSLEYVGRLSSGVSDYANTKSRGNHAALQGEQP